MKNKITAVAHTSPWIENIKTQPFPVLNDDAKVEICIIGAGITGLTTAYLLLKEGYEVIVIDRSRIFTGDTAKTSAHLSNALDDRFYNIIKVHGEGNAKEAAESHTAAIQLIEEIINLEQIDCDFHRVKGYLFSTKQKYQEIEQEHAAVKKLGIAANITNLPNGIVNDEKKCLMFENQAQFHPIKYLMALANIILKKGEKIYQETCAKDVDIEKNTIDLANGKKINAKYIIQASNTPVHCSLSLYMKEEANRSYVLGLAIPKNSLEMALYWDNEDPYHYVRIMPNDGKILQLSEDDDLLIVGGADHRVGLVPNENPYFSLEKWVRKTVPQVKEVLFEWSGQILEPVDYLAFMGKTLGGSNNNNYMVTGDSGNGLTHGTIGAMIIRDLIKSNHSKWEGLYDPNRKSFSTAKDFLANISKSTVGYGKYLSSGEIANVEELLPGHGGVIREGLKKLAVFRDHDGVLHKFSAVCPHLKAILSWNPFDNTWDCAAHGSRFAAKGDLINGPAKCGLTCLAK